MSIHETAPSSLKRPTLMPQRDLPLSLFEKSNICFSSRVFTQNRKQSSDRGISLGLWGLNLHLQLWLEDKDRRGRCLLAPDMPLLNSWSQQQEHMLSYLRTFCTFLWNSQCSCHQLQDQTQWSHSSNDNYPECYLAVIFLHLFYYCICKLDIEFLSEINKYHWPSLYCATYIYSEKTYFPDLSSGEIPTVLNFLMGTEFSFLKAAEVFAALKYFSSLEEA